VQRFRHLSILLLSILALSAKGQNNSTNLKQYWVRYYNQLHLKNNFSLHSEVDERRNFQAPHQSQFFIHIHLHYRVKPWLDVAAGQNFNLTDSPVNPSLEVPEWRPWQEVSVLSNTDKKLLFQFRYRLDERFIHNNNKVELEEGYHFNLRHRFRFQAGTKLFTFEKNRNLAIRVSDEIMVNTGDVPRLFDQNRMYYGLELTLSNQWSIEGGYLNIVQPLNDSEYLTRNIIRTTFYHRLSL
jgi:hypothetical protein